MKVLTEKILKDNNITHGLDEIFTQVPSWNRYFFSILRPQASLPVLLIYI